METAQVICAGSRPCHVVFITFITPYSVALDGSSRRKALGMPENAAVPPEAASRSGRAKNVRFANGAQPR
jgi:hypothetical protein